MMTKDSEPYKWRVVICGSMSCYAEMMSIRKALRRAGVHAIIPTAEDNVREHMSDEDFVIFKRKVSYQYLRKIRHPSTYGILAINRDKLGVHDYIGPNTFAEIAVAFAQSKKIYLFQDIPVMYKDELIAWRAVPLRGQIAKLAREFSSYRREQTAQLRLFGT